MERTRELITGAVKAWWDSLAPAPFPLEYDNLAGGKTPNPEPWGRLTVQQGTEDPAAIGTKHLRCMGMVMIQVFIPPGRGTKIATAAGQLVSTAYGFAELNATDGAGVATNVVFQGSTCELAGARDGYQQWNIIVNFRRDTIKP